MGQTTLHFSLGKNFGALLSQIAQEHITTEYDHIKAFEVFSKSGAPVEYALQLLEGTKVITVDDNGIDCYVVDRNSLTAEELDERGYPAIMNWQFWVSGHVAEYLQVGYSLMGDLKDMFAALDICHVKVSEDEFKEMFDVPEHLQKYNWRGSCELTGEDIIDIWNQKNLDMIRCVEYDSVRTINNRISDVFNQLDYFRNFIHREVRFLSCATWLLQQYGSNSKLDGNLVRFRQLVADGAAILTMAKEVDGEGINRTLAPYMKATEAVEEMGHDEIRRTIKYVQDQMRIREEVKQLRPVDISKNFDAGFISPDGKVYALMGATSQLLHIQLADALFDMYDWPEPENHMSRDWALMKKGWVKFHHGWCLYEGYDQGYLTGKDVPLTSAQIEELERYAEAQGGQIRCGYDQTPARAGELTGQDDEYYRNLFSIM